MRYLTLALVAVLGFVTTDAAAQCMGCGKYGDCGTPITCDYSHLWANFSPSTCHYKPQPGIPCGGCRLGGGGLVGHLAGVCPGHGVPATAGDCSEPNAACAGDECSAGADVDCAGVGRCHPGCGILGRLLRRSDNCCPPPSPNIGWDGWGHGCGGAGLGGYGGHSLASWHGLGGGGHRLMGGGCDPCCYGSGCAGGCALGCHSFHVGWLGSLMERLRNCGSARAMCHGSLDPCGLLSSKCASYPAGNLNVSFGCANGCSGDASSPGGEAIPQPDDEPSPTPAAPIEVPAPDPQSNPVFHDVEPAQSSQLEDAVPQPPGNLPAGTDAKLKMNQFSLKR